MRPVLRLLGTRYGIAAVLLVLLLAVMTTFRAVSGSRREPMAPPIEPSHSVSVAPGGGDDGLAVRGSGSNAADDEDDVRDLKASASAGVSGEVTDTASAFTTAWLRHLGVTADQWYNGLAPYATAALLAKLKGVDPTGVPADHTTGSMSLVVRDPNLVEAMVPLDAGKLRLRLVTTAGHWKVDGVDWVRPT